MNKTASGFLVSASLIFVTHFSEAHPAIPWQMPATRLITNLEARLRKTPNDADERYSLGRVYYAAFLSNNDEISVVGISSPNEDPKDAYVELFEAGSAPKSIARTPAMIRQKVDLLRRAIENLQIAIKLKPDDPYPRLTLGSAFEDGLPYASQVAALETGAAAPDSSAKSVSASIDPKLVTSSWRSMAAEQYLRGFDLNYKHDAKGWIGGGGTSLSREAGDGYTRLAAIDPAVVRNSKDLKRVKTGLAALSQAKMIGITPVVFMLRKSASLADAQQASRIVRFDLAATGQPQEYTWLQPNTGILVWDPSHSGHITSGRQLFGSVTWWVFWRDGYQALEALDDNHDGRLSGNELNGIGVWFDQNSNGVCDPGEVVTATALGITSISCRATGHEDGALVSDTGICMANGEVFKSWDWVAEPCSPTNSSAPMPKFTNGK